MRLYFLQNRSFGSNKFFMHRSLSLSLRILIIVITVSLSFGSLRAQKSIEEKLHKEIKKILRYEIEWKKKATPGFVVVVVEEDTSFTVKFGHEINATNEINDDRIYGIGGLSKVYTSIAIAQAIKEGMIDTSKTISDVLPGYPLGSNPKIKDFIQHTAGYPRTLKMINVNRSNDFENMTEDEFIHGTEMTKMNDETTFLYNHHDYVIVEKWLTEETNHGAEYWYNKAKETFTELPEWRSGNREIIGLGKSGNEINSINYGVYESSLGLSATKDEIEKLIRFLLSENELSEHIKSDATDTDIKKNIYFTNGLYKISNGKKYTIYGHGGRSINNTASIHFVPETKTGLIILSNSEKGIEGLYLPLLSMINHNWRR